MESIVKKLVAEQVAKELNKRKRENVVIVDDEDEEYKPKTKHQKADHTDRTSQRMSKLMTTINGKFNKEKRKKVEGGEVVKPMRIQIRWKQRGETSYVKPDFGGGARFILYEAAEDPTFHSLMLKCQKLYFPNDYNPHFDLKVDDCLCRMLSASQHRMHLDNTVRKYLKDNHLLPSKTFFIFETHDLSYELNDTDDDENLPPFKKEIIPITSTAYSGFSSTQNGSVSSAKSVVTTMATSTPMVVSSAVLTNPIASPLVTSILPSIPPAISSTPINLIATTTVVTPAVVNRPPASTLLTGAGERKVCPVCSCSFIDFCLRCKQDAEFAESLAADQGRNHDNHENNSINDHDYTSMREKRLSFFGTRGDSFLESLTVLRSKFSNNDEKQEFSIRRRRIVNDVLSKTKLFFEDKPLAPIKADFVSYSSTESAVDDGGPMRELVTLFYEKLNGALTQGPTNNQVFVHDSSRKEDFLYFGKFVALCILQGLDTPKQFAQGLVEYIIGSDECHCTIADVSDPDINPKLKRIIDTTSFETFRTAVTAFPERFDLGYNKHNPSFEEKNKLVKAVAHSYTIASKLEEIQEFLKGLSSFGVLALLRKYPTEAKKLFSFENNLTASNLKKLFVVEGVDNDFKEDIVFNLRSILDEIHSNKSKPTEAFTFEDVEDGITDDAKKRKIDVTLEHVLIFLTGSRFLSQEMKIPIKFDEESKGRLTVSTCLPQITFPLTERYTGESFSRNFIEDILCSPGFGRV